MKLPLKHIAVLVLISLLAIFAYQGYWLGNMYRTSQERAEVSIRNAIVNADHIELFVRADSIGSDYLTRGDVNSHGSISFGTFFGKEAEEHQVLRKTSITRGAKGIVSYKLEANHYSMHDSINRKPGTDTLGLNRNYRSLFKLTDQIRKALHTAIDQRICPINLTRFDSVMRSDLKKDGLNIRFYTQIRSLNNDSIMNGDRIPPETISRYDLHKLVYDLDGEHAYFVYTEPTNIAVLKQMTGILISSLFILLIIVASFVYLIRIILRQRTLDEMKSDFTNNITHELKTPIAVAYAANDALLHFKQGDVKEKRDRYLQISMEQLQQLSRLVEQILSMSMERRKTLVLHSETFALHELIRPLIEQQKLKSDKPTEISYTESPDNLSLTTDRTHLGNIISNLIDNAVKYSNDTAQISIDCKEDETGNVFISVRDNGIGISADCQKHIFEKFYRVPTGNRHDRKGYGLGLYYVSTILSKMNGSIDVKSDLGKGSTFTVTLWKEKR